MPKVIIWRDGVIETEFDPGHRDWRIGRSETNDVTLLDPRKSVSRFHAELREENGRWVFIDLNSQNGSWKDGQRVNRLVLEHGHEVLLGDYKLAFQEVKVAAPPPAAEPRQATADVPSVPDRTLPVTGKVQPPVAAKVPDLAPPPVPRADLKITRRPGVNPIIAALFLVAMLVALAAVAWKVLSSDTDAPRVAESTAPRASAPVQIPESASTSVVPPPVDGPPPAPPGVAVSPGQPPGTGPAPPPTTRGLPPAVVPAPPPTPALPGRKAGADAPPRPKRAPPASPRDNPAVVARYDEGRRALRAGRFTDAERAFQAVLQQQPAFRDAEALLAEARDGQTSAREKSMTEAQAFEANGDWSRAIAAYERAGAAELASDARTKMVAAGNDAYRRARQYDARHRSAEAMTWYQRAVQWLPDSDARKATAQERLAALKGGAA